MKTLQIILVTIVALEHLYFMYLEMFQWTKPKGLKAFGLKKDFAEASRVLAANQGLYNGFLAAGLIWSLLEANDVFATCLSLFFLACVILAGVYGAWSTKKAKLFYIQAVPAIVAIVITLIILKK